MTGTADTGPILPSDRPAPPESRPLWIAIGCLIGMSVSTPTYFYVLSVLLKPIGLDMGWQRGAIILGIALASLTAALATPAVGIMIDRIGPRRTGLIGCIALPIAIAALALPTSYPVFLAVAALGGVMIAFASPPVYLSILPQWFDRNLGLTLAIAASGVGIGAVYMPPLMQHLIEAVGWRPALLSVSVILALAGIANNLSLIRENPAFAAARERAVETGERDILPGLSFADGLRQSDFWKLSVAFMLVVTVASAMITNLAALATDRGFSAAEGALAVSVLGGASILARLATGAMLDRLPIAAPVALFFGGAMAGLMMLWIGSPAGYLVVAAALVGAASGCESDLIPFVIRRRFGMRAYGKLYGVMFGVFQIGPIFGPLAMGVTFDRLGSYDPILPIFAAFMAAAAALTLSARFVWRRPGSLDASAV